MVKVSTCGICEKKLSGRCAEFEGKLICLECRDIEYKKQKQEFEAAQREYGLEVFGRWFNEDFYILNAKINDSNDEINEIAIVNKKGKSLFNAELDEERSWKEVYSGLKPILEAKKLLIYDADFHTKVIDNNCDKWGLERPEMKTECVMNALAEYHGITSSKGFSISSYAGSGESYSAFDYCLSTFKVIQDIWVSLGLMKKDK